MQTCGCESWVWRNRGSASHMPLSLRNKSHAEGNVDRPYRPYL